MGQSSSGDKARLSAELSGLGFECCQPPSAECIGMIQAQGVLQILGRRAKCSASFFGFTLSLQGVAYGWVSPADVRRKISRSAACLEEA